MPSANGNYWLCSAFKFAKALKKYHALVLARTVLLDKRVWWNIPGNMSFKPIVCMKVEYKCGVCGHFEPFCMSPGQTVLEIWIFGDFLEFFAYLLTCVLEKRKLPPKKTYLHPNTRQILYPWTIWPWKMLFLIWFSEKSADLPTPTCGLLHVPIWHVQRWLGVEN